MTWLNRGEDAAFLAGANADAVRTTVANVATAARRRRPGSRCMNPSEIRVTTAVTGDDRR
jgi:hypothetical protein